MGTMPTALTAENTATLLRWPWMLTKSVVTEWNRKNVFLVTRIMAYVEFTVKIIGGAMVIISSSLISTMR